MGVPIEQLQGGKLAIYELMAEESAVNYWEKYGDVSWVHPLKLFPPVVNGIAAPVAIGVTLWR